MSAAEGLTRRTAISTGLALLATPAIVRSQDPHLAYAHTAAGTFVGQHSVEGDMVFRGIRYGRAERFRAPVAEAAVKGLVQALDYGAASPQAGGRSDGTATSEDCLFLNIWTTGRGTKPKPVLFYIHGGAYSGGSGSSPLYDGTRLAQRDAVVVTINHRLNGFGYLYLARLDPRFPDSGNAGQLDILLALRWVRDNIASFGGDPTRVTVCGQSGGGAKIATMLGMPAATGLFHRAVTMSGQQVTVSGPLHATERARLFMAKAGAKSVDDLLAMPAERLVDALAAPDPYAPGGLYMGPVLDMKWLTRHPFWPDANPLGNAVPIMLGNTRQETGAFISPDSDKVRTLSWANLAERMAPELRVDLSPEWIVAQYRQRFPDWTPEQLFYDATTCGRSWPGQVIEAEARAEAGAPAWVYQVDFASRIDPRRGAMHTIDIPLAFGTLGAEGSQTGTGADAEAASRALQDRLLAFARAGSPNGAGLTSWPQYDLKRRATMIIDTLSRVEDDPRRWQRELFARAPYIQPGT